MFGLLFCFVLDEGKSAVHACVSVFERHAYIYNFTVLAEIGFEVLGVQVERQVANDYSADSGLRDGGISKLLVCFDRVFHLMK